MVTLINIVVFTFSEPALLSTNEQFGERCLVDKRKLQSIVSIILCVLQSVHIELETKNKQHFQTWPIHEKN
jgi:hypothetical protein